MGLCMKRLFILTLILALAFSALSVSGVAASKFSYIDPAPPSGWYQCAGFINTAGDDIDNGFADDCFGSEGLDSFRIRVWNAEGTLEDDVYVTGMSKAYDWSTFGYMGFGATSVKAASTYWGTNFFQVSLNGLDGCSQAASENGGVVVGSYTVGTVPHIRTGYDEDGPYSYVDYYQTVVLGNATIAARNTGYDEYRISCGGESLPDRKIAIYTATPRDLSSNKEWCAAKGLKWLKSGETPAAGAAALASAAVPGVESPSLAVAYSTLEYKTGILYYQGKFIYSWQTSKTYLARSPDGGATWSSELRESAEPKPVLNVNSVSVSGSTANDISYAYARSWQDILRFSAVDRAFGAVIDSGSPSTATYLKSPSLKALDRDNLVASYIQQKPSYGTCGWTYNYLKFASSANGGRTWSSTVVSSDHSDYASIDAVGQTIFISYNEYHSPYATCEQGGYAVFAKSTDGGKGWTRLNIESGASGGTSISAADAKNVFVAYSIGDSVKVASSPDGGSTWRKVKVDSGSSPSVRAVSQSAVVVAYRGSDGSLKFARSSDGGSTWAVSTVEPSAASGIRPVIGVAGSGAVYIAYAASTGNDITVARSNDGGSTWSKSTIGNAEPVRDISLFVEAKAGRAHADPEFKDSRGERAAPEGVRLIPGREGCSSSFKVARSMECAAGVCANKPDDAALCDKASDCVYNGKCYSDIKSVAATFFSNDPAAVWNSAWQPEVAADVNGDGRLEVCDPGQWQNPTGAVAGTVTDASTSAPVSSAAVSMVGTPPNQGTTFAATTAGDGTYTIHNVNALTYDMTASKAGFNSAVKANEPIQPFQTNTVDFQLTPGGAGGVWGGGTASISGVVRNITGQPVGGAVVKVLGTSLSATTAADGTYSIEGIPTGNYDISASKPGDGYTDATALGINVAAGTTTVDFTLLLSLGSCTNDCTKVGSSSCDASCDGKGSCKFYSPETKAACDGTFGIIDLPGGRQVSCCKGQPYKLQKADVIVQAKQVVKTVKPVLYRGRLVNLVTLLFIPDRQS